MKKITAVHTNVVSLSFTVFLPEFNSFTDLFLAPDLFIQNECTDQAESVASSGKYEPAGTRGGRTLYKKSTQDSNGNDWYFLYNETTEKFEFFPTTEPFRGTDDFDENALSKYFKYKFAFLNTICHI